MPPRRALRSAAIIRLAQRCSTVAAREDGPSGIGTGIAGQPLQAPSMPGATYVQHRSQAARPCRHESPDEAIWPRASALLCAAGTTAVQAHRGSGCVNRPRGEGWQWGPLNSLRPGRRSRLVRRQPGVGAAEGKGSALDHSHAALGDAHVRRCCGGFSNHGTGSPALVARETRATPSSGGSNRRRRPAALSVSATATSGTRRSLTSWCNGS